MARLFSSEYHELSSSWQFQKTILPIENEQINIKIYRDQDGFYLFECTLLNKIEKISKTVKVELIFDPFTKKIISHCCDECKTKGCKHYYSVINYSYSNLTIDILKKKVLKIYRSSFVDKRHIWRLFFDEGQILIKDVFNSETDKIRIYFNYSKIIELYNISQLLDGKQLLNTDKKTLEKSSDQLNSLTSSEKILLKKITELKCSFSKKNYFFTIYKKNFSEILPVLYPFAGKVFIYENGEKVLFSDRQLKLNFVLERQDDEILLKLSKKDFVSAVFPSQETFVFIENSVYRVKFPFRPEKMDLILNEGLKLSNYDLIYVANVVNKELHKIGCFLEIEDSLVVPTCISSYPKFIVKIRRTGDKIVMSIELDFFYEDLHKDRFKNYLPVSILFSNFDLINYKTKEMDYWFFLNPKLMLELKDFLKKITINEKLMEEMLLDLEFSNSIIFSDELIISKLKKMIFEFYNPNWDIIVSKDLESEFIASIDIVPEIKVKKSSGDKAEERLDWFEYTVNYRIKDTVLNHKELIALFEKDKDFLRLDDGSLFYVKNKKIFNEIDSFLRKTVQTRERSYRIHSYNLPYLYFLTEKNEDIKLMGDEYFDDMYHSLLERRLVLKRIKPTQSRSIETDMLQKVMRGYQNKGLEWLRMLKYFHLGGILADEMGLGKTLQAISIISESKGISIVICPKTLTFNWAAEIDKFNPNLKYLVYEGNKNDRQQIFDYLLKLYNSNKEYSMNEVSRLIIVSYSLLQNDIELFEKINFTYLVIDEAQHIKNFYTKRSKAIKRLNAVHKVALTGTPIENNIMELWSIFDFLMPGFLASAKKFKSDYQNNELLVEDKKNDLMKTISPLVLRRKKKDVLYELPDKQEQILYCKLSDIQEKMYVRILNNLKQELERNVFEEKSIKSGISKAESRIESKYFFNVLTALTRLRQLCNHPALLDKKIKNEMSEGLSSKAELINELIIDSVESGKKIVVFSQYIKMLRIMEKYILHNKLRYEYMDGSTKNRKEVVEHFNSNKDIRVMLLSLKTGGVGLNLTSADTVILVDPWWNPMVENQAIDRTHRIGQLKKVFVYKTITKGTVEEKIILLQERKKDLFQYLIERGEHFIKAMNTDQIKNLFEFNKKG